MKTLLFTLSACLLAFSTVNAVEEAKCPACKKCDVGCKCGCAQTGVCNCHKEPTDLPKNETEKKEVETPK